MRSALSDNSTDDTDRSDEYDDEDFDLSAWLAREAELSVDDDPLPPASWLDPMPDSDAFDAAPFDSAPFDSAPFEEAPFAAPPVPSESRRQFAAFEEDSWLGADRPDSGWEMAPAIEPAAWEEGPTRAGEPSSVDFRLSISEELTLPVARLEEIERTVAEVSDSLDEEISVAIPLSRLESTVQAPATTETLVEPAGGPDDLDEATIDVE
ncbi:MAG: hypothetical protein AAGA56_25890, partial [Myxococcota bacterium]